MPAALDEYFADAVAGRFGRDHAHIHEIGRLDLLEANVEAMREHQRIARLEVRRDALGVDLRLDRIWEQDHDHIGLRRRRRPPS